MGGLPDKIRRRRLLAQLFQQFAQLNGDFDFAESWHLCGNQPVCRVHRQFFTKSLGDDAAVLRSGGEEFTTPSSSGVASMA